MRATLKGVAKSQLVRMVDVAAPGVCGAGAGLDNGALCLNVAHCARGRVPRGCHGCSKPFAIVGMLDFVKDPAALAKVSSEQLKSLFDTAIRHQAVPVLLYVAIRETLPTENLLGDTDGGALPAVTFSPLFADVQSADDVIAFEGTERAPRTRLPTTSNQS